MILYDVIKFKRIASDTKWINLEYDVIISVYQYARPVYLSQMPNKSYKIPANFIFDYIGLTKCIL